MKSRILKTGNIVALAATLALTSNAWSMGSAQDTSLTPRTMVRAKGVYSAHHWMRFDSLLKKNAARFGISDWRWLKAVAINESNLGLAASVANGMANPRDTARNRSYDGRSWGVMQTTLATANDMRSGTSAEDLNDPAISIYIGAKYLAWLLSRYGGNLEKAVMAYNQGPGNTDRGKTYAGRYRKKFQSSLVLIESKGDKLTDRKWVMSRLRKTFCGGGSLRLTKDACP